VPGAKKFLRLHLKGKKLGVVAGTCKREEFAAQTSSGKKKDPIPNNQVWFKWESAYPASMKP
jgi:hypothetical protein